MNGALDSFRETDGDPGSIRSKEVISELTYDVVAGGLPIQNLHERGPVLYSASSASVCLLTEIERLKVHAANGFADLSDEQLEQALLHLEYAKAEQIDMLCRQEVASFDAGPLLWLTRYTKTENPHYEEQGLPFLAPFPGKDYFVHLFRAFLVKDPQLYIPKTRTMMTSWAAAGFGTWAGQWKQEETIIQIMNEDKALHLIDCASQLFKYQEPGLSRLHPIKKQNAFLDSMGTRRRNSSRTRGTRRHSQLSPEPIHSG